MHLQDTNVARGFHRKLGDFPISLINRWKNVEHSRRANEKNPGVQSSPLLIVQSTNPHFPELSSSRAQKILRTIPLPLIKISTLKAMESRPRNS